MEPEDPTILAEWLTRSQKAPLAVIAEFTDIYKHLYAVARTRPPRLSPIATTSECASVTRPYFHSLITPRRSPIRVFSHSSNPRWHEGDHEGEPTILYPDFLGGRFQTCSVWISMPPMSNTAYMLSPFQTLDSKKPPHLKGLEYLGQIGSLTRTASNLT